MTEDLSELMRKKRDLIIDGLRAIIAVIEMRAPRYSTGELPSRFRSWIKVLERDIEMWEAWEKGVLGWEAKSDPRD